MKQRRRHAAAIWISAMILFHVSLAAGQVSVTLPLDGYYHPGRYMPVRIAVVSTLGQAQPVMLQSPGAMRTRMMVGGEGTLAIVVPWLVYDGRARSANWTLNDTELRAGPELKAIADERELVGYINESAKVRELYGAGAIAIPLDGVDPLPGSAAAWETLDALVLDPASAGRLGSRKLGELCSAGIEIVIHGPDRPDNKWPWRRQGDCWKLSHACAGPRAAAYNEKIYEPVESWQAGWPVEFRRTIVLLGVVFAVGILGIVIWRPRFYVAILIALMGAALASLGYWWHFQFPVEQCSGQVMIVDSLWTQNDYWAYQTSAAHISADVRWADASLKPFFESRSQLDLFNPVLFCLANGDPHMLRYEIPPRGQIALMARTIGPRSTCNSPQAGSDSPLLPVVRSLYLREGHAIVGQLPSTPVIGSPYVHTDQWPCVVVERKEH